MDNPDVEVVLMRLYFFFFFNDTATTEIYTLSLHDALPIFPFGAGHGAGLPVLQRAGGVAAADHRGDAQLDRKSTRLNSSHSQISYAVFCLKKKLCELLPHDLVNAAD